MKKIILLTTVIAVIFSMTCFVHADTSGGETDPEDIIIEEDTGAPARSSGNKLHYVIRKKPHLQRPTPRLLR